MNRIRTVSVIITTFNRYHTLKKNIACLEGQTYPREQFEVIIVDDHSTDATWGFLKAYAGPLALDCYVNPEGSTERYGYISCNNIGLERACNELCIFLDSDLLPEKHLIEEHVKTHNEWRDRGEGVVCRGWRTEDYGIDELSAYDHDTDKDYDWKLRYYIDNADNIVPEMCIGNNFSVLRKNAVAVGGFDQDRCTYGQDLRVPLKCHHLLGLRVVANVSAYGSHRPLPGDAPSKNSTKTYSRTPKAPVAKVNCLVTLAGFYMKLEKPRKAAAAFLEAEDIVKREMRGNPSVLDQLDRIRTKAMNRSVQEMSREP